MAGSTDCSPIYFYTVFGLYFRSALPLPELTATETATVGTFITIRLGTVAPQLVNARNSGPAYQMSEHEFLLDIPHVARYHLKDADCITIDPAAGASMLRIRLFLLGAVLGVLCHRLGMLPLHASAVVIRGRVLAFAGKSGAGKSTLAAFFNSRGHQILCDDVCVVSRDHDGMVRAWPGSRRIKLWRDTLDVLGRAPGEALEQAVAGMEKYQMPIDTGASNLPVHLDRLYVLDTSLQDSDSTIQPVRGIAAIDAVMAQTYRPQLLSAMGKRAEHLRSVSDLLKSMRVFSFRRRWGHAHHAEQARVLERHFLNAEALRSA